MFTAVANMPCVGLADAVPNLAVVETVDSVKVIPLSLIFRLPRSQTAADQLLL